MSTPPGSCQHPHDRATFLFEARDYISGDRFKLVRCDACGLTRTEPVPSARQWSRYYPAGYFGEATAARFPPLVERLQNLLYGGRALRVERLWGRPGRVLDIGCGRGFLLARFRSRGWETLGTEASPEAGAYARDVLGLPIQVGDLATLGLPAASFDAVVLWHVLEHVADPAGLVAEVARVLRPGGILLVGVPDFGSAEARLTRRGWLHLDVPRHLNHFTAEGLERALRSAGLAAVARSGFAPEYDLFSFVQSALNRIGLRHNLLYEVLRGRGAKILKGESTGAGQVALSLVLGVPLAVIGAVWTLVAGAFLRGATVTMYARKA